MIGVVKVIIFSEAPYTNYLSPDNLIDFYANKKGNWKLNCELLSHLKMVKYYIPFPHTTKSAIKILINESVINDKSLLEQKGK